MAPAIRGETNDSGSDQGGNSGSEEKWLDFRKCLKVELPYFLNMKCGRKREVKDNSVFFLASATQKITLLAEMEKSADKA